MKKKSFDDSRELGFSNCPFCGAEPTVTYIGNNHTKKRSIFVKCPSCRAERTDSTLRHDFRWLEDVAIEQWNQRPTKEN